MRDKKAAVYDRRTGKRLGKKAFKAKNATCEEWIEARETMTYSEVDEDAVITWLGKSVR